MVLAARAASAEASTIDLKVDGKPMSGALNKLFADGEPKSDNDTEVKAPTNEPPLVHGNSPIPLVPPIRGYTTR